MRINTFWYCLKQGIINICRNILFSLASIATISACIFLFCLFFALVANINYGTRMAENTVGISVFFDESLSQEEIETIGQEIGTWREVREMRFTSAEEAWDTFKEVYFEGEEELAAGFEEDNPLAGSASYEIFLHDIGDQEEIAGRLEAMEGVRRVRYSSSLVEGFTNAGRMIGLVSAMIIAILLAVAVFLISNTISVAAAFRRRENEIMRYIGATNFMIRAPFVVEGMLLGLLGAVFSSYATSVEMDDAKEQMSALEEEKARVESTLQGLESLKADAAAYVQELDASLSEVSGELERLAGEIAAKEEEIAQAQVRLEEAKAREESQYGSMKLRIKYMYENGETSALETILSAGSIAELLNRAEYASQIAAYDRRMLTAYGEAKEAVRLEEETLEGERQSLLDLEESTRAKESSLEELMAAKTAQLASYEAQIEQAQGELDQYNADIAAQEQLMREIEAEMKRREEEARKQAEAQGETYTTTDLGNISFIWPCPSSSRITSYFGDRESPTEGASSNHKGVDIGAGTGADILAAAGGEVVISTYSYSAGNYIMIDHGGGVSTVYMHCSQLLVQAGDQVSQGQVIAKVGSTGYSTGPHLHLGIRSDGSYVNPLSHVSP